MEIVPLTPDLYAEWDAFCEASDEAWFWHTSRWIEYAVNYWQAGSTRSFSFFAKDEHGIVAICPLVEECFPSPNGVGTVREFSMSYGGGFSSPTPALANGLTKQRHDQILDAVMEYVDCLAQQRGVARTTFRLFPLSPAFHKPEVPLHNYLSRYGYIDISLSTQIISLGRDIQSIWHDIRKGHRYDIRRGLQAVEHVSLTYENISINDFTAYCDMHRKAAGRVTRPDTTFELQYQWVQQGKAALFGSRANERWLGFAFVLLYKDGAYYQSGCEDPEADISLPIGHTLQWHIIGWLKKRGYAFYEIGWQYFSPQPYCLASEKERSISAFKRYFGGQTVPLFSGEKFYSREYCSLVWRERIERLSAALPFRI